MSTRVQGSGLSEFLSEKPKPAYIPPVLVDKKPVGIMQQFAETAAANASLINLPFGSKPVNNEEQVVIATAKNSLLSSSSPVRNRTLSLDIAGIIPGQRAQYWFQIRKSIGTRIKILSITNSFRFWEAGSLVTIANDSKQPFSSGLNLGIDIKIQDMSSDFPGIRPDAYGAAAFVNRSAVDYIPVLTGHRQFFENLAFADGALFLCDVWNKDAMNVDGVMHWFIETLDID